MAWFWRDRLPKPLFPVIIDGTQIASYIITERTERFSVIPLIGPIRVTHGKSVLLFYVHERLVLSLKELGGTGADLFSALVRLPKTKRLETVIYMRDEQKVLSSYYRNVRGHLQGMKIQYQQGRAIKTYFLNDIDVGKNNGYEIHDRLKKDIQVLTTLLYDIIDMVFQFTHGLTTQCPTQAEIVNALSCF